MKGSAAFQRATAAPRGSPPRSRPDCHRGHPPSRRRSAPDRPRAAGATRARARCSGGSGAELRHRLPSEFSITAKLQRASSTGLGFSTRISSVCHNSAIRLRNRASVAGGRCGAAASSSPRQLSIWRCLSIRVRRVISVGCRVDASWMSSVASARSSAARSWPPAPSVSRHSSSSGSQSHSGSRCRPVALVLLDDVDEVQEVAEGARDGQQRVLVELLQRQEQLAMIPRLATARGFREPPDRLHAIEHRRPSASAIVSPRIRPSRRIRSCSDAACAALSL